MPFGEYHNYLVVNQGDTVPLKEFLLDDDNVPYTAADLLVAEFEVKLPDGTTNSLTAEIEDDGSATALFSNTSQKGSYISLARFTLDNGERRSTRSVFEVEDPFESAVASNMDRLSDAVWARLEDCFDSTEGGPWLRDVTLRYFNKRKMPMFASEGLLEINMAPPMTHAVLGDFFTVVAPSAGVGIDEDPDMPVLVQGTLLAVIRHLMRSYVEQPEPRGAQVVFEDRRDYLERWQTIYQIENEKFLRWVALWKRQFFNLGHSSLLLGSKAGRLIQAPMRTRTIGRGYY